MLGVDAQDAVDGALDRAQPGERAPGPAVVDALQVDGEQRRGGEQAAEKDDEQDRWCSSEPLRPHHRDDEVDEERDRDDQADDLRGGHSRSIPPRKATQAANSTSDEGDGEDVHGLDGRAAVRRRPKGRRPGRVKSA